MPPAPIGARISYGPSVVPGESVMPRPNRAGGERPGSGPSPRQPCLPQGANRGDCLEVAITMQQEDGVIERDLGDATVDRAPNRLADSAQIEENPCRLVPGFSGELQVILGIEIPLQKSPLGLIATSLQHFELMEAGENDLLALESGRERRSSPTGRIAKNVDPNGRINENHAACLAESCDRSLCGSGFVRRVRSGLSCAGPERVPGEPCGSVPAWSSRPSSGTPLGRGRRREPRSFARSLLYVYRHVYSTHAQSEACSSPLQPHETPVFGPGKPRHLKRRLAARLDGKAVAEVHAEPVLGVVETGLDREDHARLEHRVIAEREVRGLMSLHPHPVRGAMVDVLLHPLFHLELVNLVRDGRTGDPVSGNLLLHDAAVARD